MAKQNLISSREKDQKDGIEYTAQVAAGTKVRRHGSHQPIPNPNLVTIDKKISSSVFFFGLGKISKVFLLSTKREIVVSENILAAVSSSNHPDRNKQATR